MHIQSWDTYQDTTAVGPSMHAKSELTCRRRARSTAVRQNKILFCILAEADLFSNRQRGAEHAGGHIGSACAGKWRNIESHAATIRGTQISTQASVQVSAAVQGHPVAAYRAAKKAGADQKCGRAGRGDRQIINVDL
jgi:hypothetical protein